jgi:hypothetical protein
MLALTFVPRFAWPVKARDPLGGSVLGHTLLLEGVMRRAGSVLLGVWVCALSLAARAQAPGPITGTDGASLRLQRGQEVMTLLGDPPRLLGDRTDLAVSGDRVSGWLDGERYDAVLAGDRATGRGPNGKIDLQFRRNGDALEIVGTWNGQPLHMTSSPNELRADVVRRAASGSEGMERCHFDLGTTRGQLTGPVSCLGREDDLRLTLQPTDAAVLRQRDSLLLLAAFLGSPPDLRTR